MNDSIQCPGYCKACDLECYLRSAEYKADALDRILEDVIDCDIQEPK